MAEQELEVKEEQVEEISLQVQKSCSIDELYEKVKDYDLILTAEASLKDALNNRLEEPKLDYFATTPMLYVLNKHQNEKLAQERRLFIEFIKHTDFSWKKSSYLLENIIECWQEEGSKEAIKDYSKFHKEDIETALNVIENTKNVYSEMEAFEIDSDKNVAVVNYHQFNQLDRKVAPDDADKIRVFKDEQEELSGFKVYNSVTSIIQALKQNINQENASDISIVAEPDSKYTTLIQSVLTERDIPFLHKKDMSESQDLRVFLRILHLSLRRERLKLKDCRSVLRTLDYDVSVERDNEYIKNIEGEIDEFKDLLSEISKCSVGDALERFEEFNQDCSELKENLDELGILGDEVANSTLRKLEYYLDTYSVDSQGSNQGVLFVSPKAGAYVDRPIVFYLGMGSSWTSEIPERPWIDREKREETNLKDFEALVQNGVQQHYMVQEKEMNEEVKPCLYFNTLTDEEFESFTDLRHERYQAGSESSENGFEKEEPGVEPEDFNALSPSTLDKLVECPRQCLFNWVVSTPDKARLRKGDLLHDFAEFYVNYPEFVEDQGMEKLVQIMEEHLEPLIDDLRFDKEKTELKIGARNLKEYLENKEFEEAELNGFENDSNDNYIAKYFDKDITSGLTEVKFENTDIHVKGKTDLVPTSEEMVDYKSTTKKDSKNSSASKIVSHSQKNTDKPNFQAKLYLMALREANPDQRLEFTFFRFLSNIGKEMSGRNTSTEDNLVTVRYYPGGLNAASYTREAFDYVNSESEKRKEFLDDIGGYETYKEVMQELEIPEEIQGSKDDVEEACKEDLADIFEKRDELDIGYNMDYTRNQLEGKCKSVLRRLVNFEQENYFKPELDEFEEFLEEKLENLNQYQRTKFPLNGTDPEETHYEELILK